MTFTVIFGVLYGGFIWRMSDNGRSSQIITVKLSLYFQNIVKITS